MVAKRVGCYEIYRSISPEPAKSGRRRHSGRIQLRFDTEYSYATATYLEFQTSGEVTDDTCSASDPK